MSGVDNARAHARGAATQTTLSPEERADPIQAAKERLAAHVQAFYETEPRSRHLDDVSTLLAELSRLEGENERLRDAFGDAHGDRLFERARAAEAALTEARRESSELRDGLKEALPDLHYTLDHIEEYEDDDGEPLPAGNCLRRAIAILNGAEAVVGEEDEGPCAICSDPDDDGPCPEHRPEPAGGAKARLAPDFDSAAHLLAGAVAKQRQHNAIAAFLVSRCGVALEAAGDLARQMLDAAALAPPSTNGGDA